MKNCAVYLFLALASVHLLPAQGISIGIGTTLSLGAATLSLSGNWTNSGTFNPGTGTVIFNGPSPNQSITNGSGETFQNLTVNKAAGDVVLNDSITVNGTLTMTSGDLDLNGKTITLGLSGLLSETPGNTVKGSSGAITTTRTLGTSPGNVGGLGASFSSAFAFGLTTVTRGHTVQAGSGNYGISRYYIISPTTNTGLSADVVLSYDDSELNGLIESTLEGFESGDGGSSWSALSGTLNTTPNTYSIAGVNSLSRYTLASTSAPLPVEMVSFTASANRFTASLHWTTASEVNTAGFEIERRPVSLLSPEDWQKVGFLEGKGTKSSSTQYSFDDVKVPAGKQAYRIKQIDRDGTFKYSVEAEVEVGLAPKEFRLEQNYPNPFNPVTTIEFTLADNGRATLKIFDLLGREIATLFDQNAEAGRFYDVQFDGSRLASGPYISLLESGSRRLLRKILLLK